MIGTSQTNNSKVNNKYYVIALIPVCRNNYIVKLFIRVQVSYRCNKFYYTHNYIPSYSIFYSTLAAQSLVVGYDCKYSLIRVGNCIHQHPIVSHCWDWVSSHERVKTNVPMLVKCGLGTGEFYHSV